MTTREELILFLEAIRSGNLQVLEAMHLANPGIISGLTGIGNWLSTAALTQHEGVVRWLLGKGVDPSGKDGPPDSTPLCHAFIHENFLVARILLEHGADPNFSFSVISPVNGTKMKPLVAIKLLDEFGADLNRQYVFEQTGFPITALSMAKDNELHDVVRYLESRGCRMPTPVEG